MKTECINATISSKEYLIINKRNIFLICCFNELKLTAAFDMEENKREKIKFQKGG